GGRGGEDAPGQQGGGERRDVPHSHGDPSCAARRRPISAPGGLGESDHSLMVSPPLRVISARSIFSSMLLARKRTEPSAEAALKPVSKMPPSFGSGFFGS